MDHKEALQGIVAANFRAAHADHIQEYPAARFHIGPNGQMVRIAFGQAEVRKEDGTLAAPRYHIAVSMPPPLAVMLRDWLLKMYPIKPPSAPKDDGAEPDRDAGQSPASERSRGRKRTS